MTTWFVSRHPGAIDWAASQGWRVDRHCAHLDPAEVMAGDIVIGSLPVNLAAEVCRQGAQFINLSIDLPAHLRGKELTLEQMNTFNARLEAFDIISKPMPSTFEPAAAISSLSLIEQLPILQIKVSARSLGMILPHNMGSAWHGGLGKVLHDTQPQAYAALYANQHSHAPLPYVLRPPELTTDPAEGVYFEFSVILIGIGVTQAVALVQAIYTLAQQGVGPGRGRFTVEAIDQKAITFELDAGRKPQDITLSLLTPTLLKQGNQHLKQAPSLLLLLKRILWRTEQFLQSLPEPLVLPAALRQQLLQLAEQASLGATQLHWHNTPRYSARQKAWMPFGGLAGHVQYQNVPSNLLPWLQLAEWLHLGNKTTFGHGRIAILAPQLGAI